MRKATCSVIAGNPPAEAAQPSGKKGMIVIVARNVKHEPSAPRIPAFLFQNPQNRSEPNSHSETPKNQVALGCQKPGTTRRSEGHCLCKESAPGPHTETTSDSRRTERGLPSRRAKSG